MGNIFNDLNKLVNTVQKVEKILTPKRTRTKTISLTQQEVKMIREWFIAGGDVGLWERHNMTGHPTKQEIDQHNKLYEKLK
jgi:hypothetical protein